MWVLGCLGNGNNGRHVVEGMRYPNFADMWNFIMRWPLRVLCCAVENGEEKEVVRDSLRRIWAKSSCGDVRRTLCQLEG